MHSFFNELELKITFSILFDGPQQLYLLGKFYNQVFFSILTLVCGSDPAISG